MQGTSQMKRRARSKSKVEVDLIEKFLQEKARKDKLRVLQMESQIHNFCDKIEEFKLLHIKQGHVHQAPDVF